MTPETLKALRSSISHWKRLATGKRRHGERIGRDECALCKMFWDHGCKYCPVAEKTGVPHCVNTPYRDARRWSRGGLDSEEFKDAARSEMKFLQSLLPTKTNK